MRMADHRIFILNHRLSVYNNVMLLSPEVMRGLLLTCIVGMAALAGLYLRRRPLSPMQYLRWGALVLLLPLVGPFLAILLEPGAPRRRRPRRRHSRLDLT
jgi:hypothetical protein